MSGVSKRWCFTINNPEKKKEEYSEEWKQFVRYLIMGDEIGESGTSHIQGFAYFLVDKRLSALKKLHPTAHWEIARGSNAQAAEYCKKDGHFIVIGELPGDKGDAGGAANQRRYITALDSARRADIDTIDADLLVRHYNTWNRIAQDYAAIPLSLPSDSKVGYWVWGQSGTGKTTFVRNLLSPEKIYLKGFNKWWDGYRRQELVILEDMDPSHAWMYGYLKNWVDIHPFSCEYKGGTKLMRPNWIVVTSNNHIMDVFHSLTDEHRIAILRRFTIIEWTFEMRGTHPFTLEIPVPAPNPNDLNNGVGNNNASTQAPQGLAENAPQGLSAFGPDPKGAPQGLMPPAVERPTGALPPPPPYNP